MSVKTLEQHASDSQLRHMWVWKIFLKKFSMKDAIYSVDTVTEDIVLCAWHNLWHKAVLSDND